MMRAKTELDMIRVLFMGLLVTVSSSTRVHEQITLSTSIAGLEANSFIEQDTSNLIFASFAGLLQQWPNTFAYSGHSIIAGVIPRSTLLYHGTNRREPPPTGMEWLAFNPEMSYTIHTFSREQSELYTYVTTRPLRVIYIDGQSASLGTPGFQDSQSVLVNGTVNKEFGDEGRYLEAEYGRAQQLCKIGEKHGFEGVVRMNTGFELIWCDFKQGIEIVQVTNTTDPFAPPTPEAPRPGVAPGVPDANTPFWSRGRWMTSQAASRHFFAPGEVRVKLDPTSFISFYDRLESLSEKRRANGTDQGPRSHHRLFGISSKDVNTIGERLAKVLDRKNDTGWENDPDQIDWQGIVFTIIQTYSQPLEELAYLLKHEDLGAIEKAVQVRSLSYGMIMPYVDFSPRNLSDTHWASLSIQKCSTAFTSGTYHPSDLTESIQVIIGAIHGTLHRLCTTLYEIFSQTMHMNLPIEPALNLDLTLNSEAQIQIADWRNKIHQLLEWLGWSSWGHCNPICKPDELCLIPMWPSVGNHRPVVPDTYPICRNYSSWKTL